MGFFKRKPTLSTPAVPATDGRPALASAPAGLSSVAVASAGRPVSGSRRVSAVSHRALVKPIVSEKAAALGALRQYVFAVQPRMNKVEIAKVVNALYGVSPVAVNIVNVRGKRVRTGRTQGVRKSWKKAIVTLKAGDSIEVYHGV